MINMVILIILTALILGMFLTEDPADKERREDIEWLEEQYDVYKAAKKLYQKTQNEEAKKAYDKITLVLRDAVVHPHPDSWDAKDWANQPLEARKALEDRIRYILRIS